MPVRAFDGRTCLVTGASSGIGEAISSALALGGARVLATGRDADRLNAWVEKTQAAGVDPARLMTCAADLTDAESREHLVETVRDWSQSQLDLLVQSAGVGAYGRFMSHDAAVLRRIFEVNFLATAELARSFYPMLRRGRESAMVLIGSVVARRGLPGRSEYSASKFALAGFAEALRAEWAIDQIRVVLVNPGFTRTSFERNLIVDTAFVKTEQNRIQTAEAVARAALRAVVARRSEVVVGGLKERLLLTANRWMPRFVDWGLARWARELYARHGVGDAS